MANDSLRLIRGSMEPRWVQLTRRAIVTILFVTGAFLSLTAVVNAQDVPHGALRPVQGESTSEKILPTEPEASTTVDQWVDDLGDPSFMVREEATVRLRASGKQAEAALRKGCESDDPETARRCKQLLAELEGSGTGERRRGLRSPFGGLGRLDADSEDQQELNAWIEELFGDDGLRVRTLRMPDLETLLDDFGGFGDLGIERLLDGTDFEALAKSMDDQFQRHGSHFFHTERWEDGKKIFERSFSTDDFSEGGRTARLGVQVESVSPVLRAHLDLNEDQGLVVQAVLPESVAAAGGLERHDVILAVGDQSIGKIVDLRKAIQDQTDVEVSIIRKGKKSKLTLQFPATAEK